MISLVSLRSPRGAGSLILAFVLLVTLLYSYNLILTSRPQQQSNPPKVDVSTTEPEKSLGDLLPDVNVPDAASIPAHVVASLANEQAAARPTEWSFADTHDIPPVGEEAHIPESSIATSASESTSTSPSTAASETPTLLPIEVTQDEEQSGVNATANIANIHNHTTTLVVGRLDIDALGVQWIHDSVQGITRKAIYIVDDPNAPLHLDSNKGREAIVYVKYILEHFDDLEDVTLFFHDSRIAWHNNVLFNKDAAIMINNLRRDYVVEQGYFPARCELYPGCDDDSRWVKFNPKFEDSAEHPDRVADLFNTELWDRLFPNRTRDPTYLAEPCCSQFAASRDAIRAVGREQWQRIYDWLFSTTLWDGFSGRVMENVWQWVFLDRDAYCPSMMECYCKGYGVCLSDDTELVQYNSLRKETDDLVMQMARHEETYHCDSKPTTEEVMACRKPNPAFERYITNVQEKEKFEADLPAKLGITSP